MPRVLTCLDETPAQDGSCALQAWQEIPTLLPELSPAEVREIASAMAVLLAVAWCWKQIGRHIFR